MNNSLEFLSCQEQDIPIIMDIYEHARGYMKSKNQVVWPYFPESMIKNDITEKHLWKIQINDEIACVWTTAFNDPVIWEEKDKDPSIYIHRIATVPKFRGNSLVQGIVDWARIFAKINHKQFLRMDTVGNNQSLIAYYAKVGFELVKFGKLKSTDGLPDHYQRGDVCFFEIKL